MIRGSLRQLLGSVETLDEGYHKVRELRSPTTLKISLIKFNFSTVSMANPS
jgi:hypothetical protein